MRAREFRRIRRVGRPILEFACYCRIEIQRRKEVAQRLLQPLDLIFWHGANKISLNNSCQKGGSMPWRLSNTYAWKDSMSIVMHSCISNLAGIVGLPSMRTLAPAPGLAPPTVLLVVYAPAPNTRRSDATTRENGQHIKMATQRRRPWGSVTSISFGPLGGSSPARISPPSTKPIMNQNSRGQF